MFVNIHIYQGTKYTYMLEIVKICNYLRNKFGSLKCRLRESIYILFKTNLDCAKKNM